MSAWNEILGHVSDRVQFVRDQGRSLWFRGHREAEWKLRSTAHRYILDMLKAAGDDISNHSQAVRGDMLRRHCKTFYREFVSNTWDLLRPEERLMWSVVYIMQHHGIPTMLLDCTASFACALFFANDGRNPKADAAVFLIEAEVVNRSNPLVESESLVGLGDDISGARSTSLSEVYHPGLSFEDAPAEDRPPLPPMAARPSLTNPRMRAQQSRFLLTGDFFEPLEELIPDAVEKLTLPSDTYDESVR